MAEYPSTPRPNYPLVITPVFLTLVSEVDTGQEQRKSMKTFPTFDVNLQYNRTRIADFQTIWNFYIARKGAFEAFDFYTCPRTEDWEGLYVGVASGSLSTFDIPGKTTSDHTVYNNTVEVDSGDYTILVGGGRSSSDRIAFDTPPDEGHVITVDFTGYMRIYCRFKEDRLSREMFQLSAVRSGIELKGLKEL
jgi:hypothetical protein